MMMERETKLTFGVLLGEQDRRAGIYVDGEEWDVQRQPPPFRPGRLLLCASCEKWLGPDHTRPIMYRVELVTVDPPESF